MDFELDGLFLSYHSEQSADFDLLKDYAKDFSDSVQELESGELSRRETREIKSLTGAHDILRVLKYDSYSTEGDHLDPVTEVESVYIAETDIGMAVLGDESSLREVVPYHMLLEE